MLLTSSIYPHSWCFTKLITLFKKGARELCTNYRGISLMDSAAKLYDITLNRRLMQWFQPDREQAGSQKGRGCIEHLMTLRLLIDLARFKKMKLFVIYVDFSKAYDRVPRDLMLRKMAEKGCGSVMLNAIAAIYSNTQMLLRSATISSSIGVRQGAPTSSFLFTLVVNDLIRELKTRCLDDGFLGWLHCMMLMDDTAILATTKERAMEKIGILKDFCAASGMKLNVEKTKFMVIGGSKEDREPLQVGTTTITNCEQYTYLGSIFTQDGTIKTSLKAQCKFKLPHVLKFEAFVQKNSDLPFVGKRKVFDAALMTAILYGCETWLADCAFPIASPLYLSCVRCLLGVRKTTASDLCLLEAGLPTLPQRVKALQKQTLRKLRDQRQGMEDDPFAYALHKAEQARTPCARYIEAVQDYSPQDDADALQRRIRESERTKFATYRTLMNPDLVPHVLYTCSATKEHERIATTRFRLSSHNLAIERGRWSRVPPDSRVCPCGPIQNEQHVFTACRLNSDTRIMFSNHVLQLPDFFLETNAEAAELCHICYELMKVY